MKKTKLGRAIKINVSKIGSIDISQQTWDQDKGKIGKCLVRIVGVALAVFGGIAFLDLCKIELKNKNKMNSARHDASLRAREEERKFQHHIIEKSLDRKMTRKQELSRDEGEQTVPGEPIVEEASPWMTAEECISTAEKVEYFANTPIPKGYISALWARGGVGKTTLEVQIAATITNGKSTGLDINTDGSREVQRVMIYDSEDCVSQKLKDYPKAGFSIDNIFVKTNCNYGKLENLCQIICQEIDRATVSTTLIFDNITDSVDLPGRNDFRSSKKLIQKAMNDARERGVVITLILVSHSESQGKRMVGSEIIRDLSTDCFFLKEDDEGQISLVIDKCRNKPRAEYRVHMENQPYLHWMTDTEEENPGSNLTPSCPLNRKPITPEVEDMFLESYIPHVYGYGSIYKDFKDIYELKNEYAVRNAIDRAKKRRDKLTSESVEVGVEDYEE